MESLLLAAAIAERKAFEEIEQYEASRDFSDQGKKVLEEIKQYYEADDRALRASSSIILDRLLRKFPAEKHQDIFKTIISNLEDSVSVPNILHEIIALRKSNLKEEIRSCIEGGNEGKLGKIIEEYQQCENLAEAKNPLKVVTIEQAISLFDKVSSEALIKLSPDVLNEVTDGGMLRGHHILVFARPDCGKTTFAVELMYGFLKQGLTVLYIGNEDPEADIYARMLSRLARVPRDKLNKDKELWKKAVAKASHRNLDKFVMAVLEPGNLAQIEDAIQKFKPDVLVVDQVRNLDTPIKSRVEELEHLERNIRQMGKRHDMLTISFTQAGDSADNKLILDLGDVDYSNTGMQACADLMIGMGVTHDYEQSGRRMFSFPKNKRKPDKQPRQVTFDGEYSRIH